MFNTLLPPTSAAICTHLFGITNGQTLNHSSIRMPITVDQRNLCIPVRRKMALNCPGFLCSVSHRPSSADTGGSSIDGVPSTSESFEEISSLRPSRRVEKDREGNGAPVLSTFDFLNLKRELEKEDNSEACPKEEELRPEKSDDSPLSVEAERVMVGRSRVTDGRPVIRRSNLLAKQVIAMDSARCLGFVSQLWVDTKLWVVSLVEVRPNFLSGDAEKFLLEDVYQVGDVLLVSDEPLVESELSMSSLDTLVGYDVVKPNRRTIGKIRGYTFNINTGTVEALEFDSFGFSIIPSSLVSTFRLPVKDVLDVESDKIYVYEDALSHIQRLSKGIWDSGNIGKSKEHRECRDFRRRRIAYSDQSRTGKSQRYVRPEFPVECNDESDYWDFPLDY